MSKVQGMCLRERGKNDEQVSVPHADVSGGDTIEKKHEGKIMRSIRC